MATRPPNFFNSTQTRPSQRPIHTSHIPSFLRQLLQPHVPNSAQLTGFLTLVISGGILLLLTGVTITAIILGFIFFAPLIFITCPIWIPIGIILFIAAAGFLSLFKFGTFALGAVIWAYRYFMSKGSMVDDDSTDSADVKEYYGGDFGGYLRGKEKDTAPSA